MEVETKCRKSETDAIGFTQIRGVFEPVYFWLTRRASVSLGEC